jgi:hypothetical protein
MEKRERLKTAARALRVYVHTQECVPATEGSREREQADTAAG